MDLIPADGRAVGRSASAAEACQAAGRAEPGGRAGPAPRRCRDPGPAPRRAQPWSCHRHRPQPLLADPAGRQHARVRARGIRPGAGNVAKARTRRRRPVEPLISRAACLRPGPAFIPPGRAAGPWVECPDRTVPWRHDRSRPVGRVGDGRRPCGRGWGPAGPDPPDLWAAPLDDAKARARVHEKVYRRGPGQCHYWLGSLSSSRHGRVRPGVRTTTARRPARCQRRTSRPVNRPGRSTAPRSGLLPPARHLPPQRQQRPRSARRGGRLRR